MLGQLRVLYRLVSLQGEGYKQEICLQVNRIHLRALCAMIFFSLRERNHPLVETSNV